MFMELHTNIFQVVISAIYLDALKNLDLGTGGVTISIFTDSQATLKAVIAHACTCMQFKENEAQELRYSSVGPKRSRD